MQRILISFILLYSLLLSTEMQAQNPVKIPNLVGLKLTEAERILHNIRLTNTSELIFTTESQPGTVLEQDPEPGSQV